MNSNIRVEHGSGGGRDDGTMPFVRLRVLRAFVLQSAWKVSSILTRHCGQDFRMVALDPRLYDLVRGTAGLCTTRHT